RSVPGAPRAGHSAPVVLSIGVRLDSYTVTWLLTASSRLPSLKSFLVNSFTKSAKPVPRKPIRRRWSARQTVRHILTCASPPAQLPPLSQALNRRPFRTMRNRSSVLPACDFAAPTSIRIKETQRSTKSSHTNDYYRIVIKSVAILTTSAKQNGVDSTI